MTPSTTVLILDFGSQYTQLIARRVRDLGVFSKIIPGDASLERIQKEDPRALIIGGGPNSVYETGSPRLGAGVLDWQLSQGIPLLGICYGLQLLGHEKGGRVKQAKAREYGKMDVSVEASSGSLLFKGITKPFVAWMSHGDEIVEMPQGAVQTAKSHAGAVAAIEWASEKRYALQFHPEVTHTEKGSDILSQFLFGIAGLKADWKTDSMIEKIRADIAAQVGPNDHVLCALSGGVDSTVAAKLIHSVIGDRLHCVFVDTGLLRFEEGDRVMKLFREELGLPVIRSNAEARFLSALAGKTDPEAKRKTIGGLFIDIFEEEANQLKSKLGQLPKFLLQGTLYPDVIESAPAPQNKDQAGGFAHKIKSHHNVGGLPERLPFSLLEPFRELFKDEVRAIGTAIGTPASFVKRHPFPGPGLAVRCLGEITKEKLDILRAADEIYIETLRARGLYDQIWQAMAIFLPVRTIGVQGDGRTYDCAVALRAVTSQDGMTADWFPMPYDVLGEVSRRICNEVRGVNRVVYDVSSKPPATIEWE